MSKKLKNSLKTIAFLMVAVFLLTPFADSGAEQNKKTFRERIGSVIPWIG